MSSPQTSIIIPIFNVEDYLRECVDSVLTQSYSNLEVILVDDGSTDCSSQICDEYAAKDSRIKVIHQTNQGLSAARNAGLDLAMGEFIYFLDSDDFIGRETIQILYDAISQRNNIAIAIGYFTSYSDGLFSPYKDSWIFKEKRFIAYDKFCEHMLLEKSNHAATAKLFRRELFNTVRFQVNKKNEDTLFEAALIPIIESNRYECIDVPCYSYYYRQRSDSICHNEADPLEWHVYENLESIIKQFHKRKKLVLNLRQKQLDIAVQSLSGYIKEKKFLLYISNINHIKTFPSSVVLTTKRAKFIAYFVFLRYTPKLLYWIKNG